jgi:AmpD protein
MGMTGMGKKAVRVDVATGALMGARQVPSPNCDDRPAGVALELVVIHGISLPPGEFGGRWIDDLFTNTLDPSAHSYFAEITSLQVSAHVLIRRTGELVQYVPFHRRAWHAGQSAFRGRENCNDFAIGIELVAVGGPGDDGRHFVRQLLFRAALKRNDEQLRISVRPAREGYSRAVRGKQGAEFNKFRSDNKS